MFRVQEDRPARIQFRFRAREAQAAASGVASAPGLEAASEPRLPGRGSRDSLARNLHHNRACQCGHETNNPGPWLVTSRGMLKPRRPFQKR